MHFSLTLNGSNRKTGPIPTSYSHRGTCPEACQLKQNGCYADSGFNTKFHWDKVTAGERGVPWTAFIRSIKGLPRHQLWRHNVAGDLQGANDTIDEDALATLTRANAGKNGYTYTHYPPTVANRRTVSKANKNGFTVNFSFDTMPAAVAFVKEHPSLPAVCILPADAPSHQLVDGIRVKACPAESSEHITCANCAMCQTANRPSTVIGFRAHGRSKKTVDLIARQC